MAIWIIALHSFREAIRKRVLLVAGIFALALIGSAPFWPVMTDADRVKLVKDISLTAMTFLGVIVAIFISAYSLPSDIEEKRIFTIASKPVSRYQILVGKLCGFLMVFAAILAVMGILSDVVIRSVSTFSRIEVTAAQAPILVEGVAIGTVDKGTDLRVTGTKGDYYQVVLPDDLAVKEAEVASSDVEEDKTAGQVRVTSAEAALTHNGVEVARVSEGTELAIKRTLNGAYVVHLPEGLRITRALLAASHASPPRRSLIQSKRIVDPVDLVYSNEGTVRYETDALVLDTSVSKIGEAWRFRGIEPNKLPPGPDVRLMLRVPGIYGVAVGTDAAGRFEQATIKEFDAVLQITNLKKSRVVETVEAKAIWGGRFFTMSFDLPREALDGGGIEVAMTGTNPRFIDLSTDFFSGSRGAAWHFRGLKMRRFGAGGKINGEMQFELRQGDLPADGGRVAHVEFKIAPPSGELSEIVTVPIRNRIQAEFEFDRKLIDAEGNVDVSIHKVPESFQLGIPARDVTVKLLEKPVSFERSYFKAVALIFCQLMLVGSATVAASTFLSGGVAALVGFFTYFCGLAVNSMSHILEIGPEALAGHHHGPAAATEGAHRSWTVVEPLLKIFVTMMPDVSKLDAKTFILQGLDVPVWNVLAGVGRVLVYATVFMLIAHVVFRRKELG